MILTFTLHSVNDMESYKEGCKHINMAVNICGFTPINPGKIIKECACRCTEYS